MSREELEFLIEEEVAKATIRAWLDKCLRRIKKERQHQSLMHSLRATNEPTLASIGPLGGLFETDFTSADPTTSFLPIASQDSEKPLLFGQKSHSSQDGDGKADGDGEVGTAAAKRHHKTEPQPHQSHPQHKRVEFRHVEERSNRKSNTLAGDDVSDSGESRSKRVLTGVKSTMVTSASTTTAATTTSSATVEFSDKDTTSQTHKLASKEARKVPSELCEADFHKGYSNNKIGLKQKKVGIMEMAEEGEDGKNAQQTATRRVLSLHSYPPTSAITSTDSVSNVLKQQQKEAYSQIRKQLLTGDIRSHFPGSKGDRELIEERFRSLTDKGSIEEIDHEKDEDDYEDGSKQELIIEEDAKRKKKKLPPLLDINTSSTNTTTTITTATSGTGVRGPSSHLKAMIRDSDSLDSQASLEQHKDANSMANNQTDSVTSKKFNLMRAQILVNEVHDWWLLHLT